jgi:hypothetical protein
MWAAIWDERTGLSFTIASGLHQHSHSQVRVLWDTWTYFTVSNSRPPTWRARSPYLYPPGTGWPIYTPRVWVPFLLPPTKVEVFEPASTQVSVGRLLLAFASTVVPGFSLLEIHDQDFYSLLDMYMFRNGASSSTKDGLVFLCNHYILCTVVSSISMSMLSWQPCHYGLCAFFVTALYYVTFMQCIQRFPVNEGLCSRLCLNLCNYSETAVSQPNGCRLDRRLV